jgi:hypothetical protein
VKIIPTEESWLVSCFFVWDFEGSLIRLQEISKQEFGINQLLNIWRQLPKDVQILVVFESGKPIVGPLVFEVVFDPQF